MSLAAPKNRRLAMAALALLVVGAAAYFAAPLALSPVVARAYHSDWAPLNALMGNRATIGVEAYQAKVLVLFREALLVALTLALAAWWALWDREEGSTGKALGWPTLSARTLAILGAAALALLAIRGELPFLLPLLAALVLVLARPSAWAFPRWSGWMDAVLQPRVSLPLVLALLLVSFLVKFPPAQFDELVFFDDYPTIYTVTLKGWEMLKQGGIFGWDPAMMGGYYTVSDVSHNEIFFLLPFLPFGPRVGFHLMILFFYLAFPLLLYGYARLLFDERAGLLALWGGAFVAFGFFDNLLYWGMVNSFIGLCFLLLDLILVQLMRRGKPWASFALILALSLTLYAATGFFVYALLLIGLDFLWRFDRRMIPRLAFVMAAAFLITLTFTFSFLAYSGYFVQSDEIYDPVHYTIPEIVAQSVQALDRVTDPRFWLLGRPVRYQGLFIVSLPIIAAAVWERLRARRRLYGDPLLGVALMAAVVMLLTLVVSPSVDMFVSRIRFLLPVPLVLIYGAWLHQERSLHPAAVLVVLAILLPTLPSRLLLPIEHTPSLRAYNAGLVEAVEGLDSDLILLESMGGYDLATEGEGSTEAQESHAHLEPYFPFETSKRFMANNQEGYHHSVYRRNFITSGAFRGKLLPDWPREEIRAFLEQWGIRHLVLWTEISKGYFDGDPAFVRIWEDGFWAIYAYDQAAPGDVWAESARGTLEPRGYFAQEVRLTQARAGELVRLRMNYFPAWRASQGGQAVELREQEGQMAFVAPADGDYVVELAYPRYAGLSVLALGAIVVSFLLVRRFREALSVPACAGEREGGR